MSNDNSGQPFKGPFVIDLSALQDFLFDLAHGAMQRLRTEQADLPQVIEELAARVPVYGAAACISQDVYDHFVNHTNTIAKIDEYLGTVTKIAEVLKETRAVLDHERHNDLSMIIDAVRSTAQRGEDKLIMAQFEKTLKYNAQMVEEPATTRKPKLPGKRGKSRAPDKSEGGRRRGRGRRPTATMPDPS